MRFWRKGNKMSLKPETVDGHRLASGSEVKAYVSLKEKNIPFTVTNTTSKEYSLEYVLPTKRYHPDFLIGVPPRAFWLEVKGYFWSEDRTRLLAVKQNNPHADIRLLFDKPHSKLNKTSKTTYASWCEQYGFPWAQGPDLPEAWLKDVSRET